MDRHIEQIKSNSFINIMVMNGLTSMSLNSKNAQDEVNVTNSETISLEVFGF